MNVVEEIVLPYNKPPAQKRSTAAESEKSEAFSDTGSVTNRKGSKTRKRKSSAGAKRRAIKKR